MRRQTVRYKGKRAAQGTTARGLKAAKVKSRKRTRSREFNLWQPFSWLFRGEYDRHGKPARAGKTAKARKQGRR